jgi:hypothetical protein
VYKGSEGVNGVVAKCPIDECDFIVPNALFLEHLPHNLIDSYKALYNSKFLDTITNQLTYCPTTHCHNLCRKLKSWRDTTDVRCEDCGAHFCFKCKRKAHQPIDCKALVEWLKLVQDNTDDDEGPKSQKIDETAEWILKNTKPCPKCKVNIEKN